MAEKLARIESRIGSGYLYLCAGHESPSLGNTDPTKICHFEPFYKDEAERVVRALNTAAESWAKERERVLVEALKKLGAGVDAVEQLMRESAGVDGLHQNGDLARWDELTTGGRFEEWLSPLDEAVKTWDAIKNDLEEFRRG